MAQRWAELQAAGRANKALAGDDGSAGSTPLNEVPARRLDVVLAEWRQAEMTQSLALPGSPEAEHAAEEVARLRSEYGMLRAKAERAAERADGGGRLVGGRQSDATRVVMPRRRSSA